MIYSIIPEIELPHYKEVLTPKQIKNLADKPTKKVLKMLKKHYEILSVEKQTICFEDETAVPVVYLVIYYVNPEEPKKKFKWKVKLEQI